MITHIIHGSDIPKELVSAIEEQLAAETGILKFKFHTVDDGHLKAGNWIPLQDLFDAGHRFREANQIPVNDFVITLTDRSNAQNYYASLDPLNTRTGFIHTGDWERYIDCVRELPIAFTIVNLLVVYYTCPIFSQMEKHLHKKHIGCANDLCTQKYEVIFKLRTGDICKDCIEAMRRNNWSILGIDHAMRIMSALSKQMLFNNHFDDIIESSRIRIEIGKYDRGTLSLPEYGGLIIDMDPMDLAFYLFFLRYKGDTGLHMTVFSNPWAREAFGKIYGKFKPLISEAEMDVLIDKLANRKSNIRSEIISRINGAFTSILGPRLALHYLIKGERSKPFRIEVPLTKVEVINFKSWMELPNPN